MASGAFEAQLVTLLPKMRIWAIAMTRNRAAAEDLVQDTAAKALLACEAFEPVSGGVNPRLNGASRSARGGRQRSGDRIVVRLCDEGAVVLAAVQDASRRQGGGLKAILDCCCARQHARAQVGTAGWPSLIEQQDCRCGR